MATALNVPAIPGVTTKPTYDRDVPAIEEALATEDETARGAKLLTIAKARFRYWTWYYDEVRETAAMLAGAQYGFWDEKLQRFVIEPETEDRDVVRVVCNLEVAVTRQAVAILTQGDPIFGTYPGADEVADLAASEASDLISRYLWRYDRMANVFKRAAKGAFAFGCTPVLEEWNTADGEPVFPPPAAAPFSLLSPPAPEMQMPPGLGMPSGVGPEGLLPPEPGAMGAQAPQVRFKGMGRTSVLRRDQVAFDPAAQDVHDGDCLIIKQEPGRVELEQLYPDKVNRKLGVDTESGRTESDINRFSAATGRRANADERDADKIATYTFFVKRTAKMPFGKTIRIDNTGKILDEGKDNPVYPTREELAAGEQWPNYHWPVVFYMGDEREGCPFGAGRLLHAHGLQKTFNGDLSKIVQHHAIIANTKIVLPQNLDVEWDDDIGQIIRLPRGMKTSDIGYLTPPSVPQDAIPLLRNTQTLIEYVTGVNASTIGQTDSGDQSGRAIEGLQQRDTAGLDDIKRNLYRAAEQHMELKLRYFRRYAEEKRKMVVVGANEQIAVKHFDRAALAAGTDVVCFNDSSLPSEPGKRIMAIMNIGTALQGAPDERWRMALLKLFRLHDFHGFFRTADPFADRMERVKRQILAGQLPQYMPWDNALAVKAGIEELLLSEECEAKIAAEGGFIRDPVSGQFQAKGPIGQTAYAFWLASTQQSAPQAPPGAVPGAQAASPAPTTGQPPAQAPTTGPMAQAA